LKTRIIRRVFIAGAATTLALWAAPASVDTLAGLGSPTKASAEIGTTCGPAIDGAVIFDDGVGWECRNIGPGQYGWVRIE
jgi:hypothetical protein